MRPLFGKAISTLDGPQDAAKGLRHTRLMLEAGYPLSENAEAVLRRALSDAEALRRRLAERDLDAA